ncbi:MAG TPA: hypothetical protein VGH89_12380 [Pseudonocardia sp.]|jgi:hypothetical protein
MRGFVFAPRWVAGHLLVVLAVASCILLGRWQWHVSMHTHSLQNLAYAVQWPLFAVFFAVMWWRMLRLEVRKRNGEFDEESGHTWGTSPEPAVAAVTAAKPAAPPPAGPATPEPADTDPEDAELAAYNRMLAELAAQPERR